MQKKQIYCTQCGAVIPPGEARCQYCGSSYAPEAENEYMRRLDQVRRDLEKVGNVGAETSRTESGRVRRRVLRILVTILVLSAAVYGLFLYQQRRGNIDRRREYAWRAENLPELDRLYEEGDYEALMQAWHKAQEDGYSLYDWEHTAFCEFYEAAAFAGETLRMREKGLFQEDDAVMLLYDELCFRGLTFRKGIPSEDQKAIRELIRPFEDDLTVIFHASGEELDAFDQELDRYGGYPVYDSCRTYVQKHPEILLEE